MPVKDAARVKAGRKAQRGGQRFEDELEAAHAVLRERLIADIHHLPIPTRQVGTKLIRIKRQRFDYQGWFYRGRGIAMEAKSFEGTSMPIRDGDGAGIKRHQLMALIDADDWGHFAAIVWRNGDKLFRFTAFGSLDPAAKSIPLAAFERLERLEDWISPPAVVVKGTA
jgi:penicillin-binding protein-related factor A (putative recombinase)